MKMKVRLEKDEDGVWVSTCPSLPGCVSQGKTQKEAINNIKEAARLHISSLIEDGLPLIDSEEIKETLVEVVL